jgi:UPF0271 protein
VTHIDLNCDMGEIPELLNNGTQEALLCWVSSVNIACGGHAGDQQMMRETALAAERHGVKVGAHPGYPDRAHFGRVPLALSVDEIVETIAQQVGHLAKVLAECGLTLSHGKAHGALYNQGAVDPAVAAAIADGFARVTPAIPLMGLAGSTMLNVFAAKGFQTLPEAFVDRRYEADGRLRDRTQTDSLISDPEAAAAQALSIARDGVVTAVDGTVVRLQARTLCVHGDSPGAPGIARAVRMALESTGIGVGSAVEAFPERDR